MGSASWSTWQLSRPPRANVHDATYVWRFSPTLHRNPLLRLPRHRRRTESLKRSINASRYPNRRYREPVKPGRLDRSADTRVFKNEPVGELLRTNNRYKCLGIPV